MNFYTLTFKHKVFIALCTLFLCFVTVNIILSVYVSARTSNKFFINEKYSKIRHFELNNIVSPDIIFLGSSRTFYQISTNMFKDNGINIYNLGIAGALFENYPAAMNSIIKSSPKRVIISLSIQNLYEELPLSKFPTIVEAYTYYKVDKAKVLKALLGWGISNHLFFVYSEAIFFKIKSIYNMFEPKVIAIDGNFPLKKIDYSKIADCNIFDIKHTNINHTTLKCQNGDGILVGINLSWPLQEKVILTSPNKKSVQYLQEMINNFKNEGIEVSIIFDPIPYNPYVYELEDIKRSYSNTKILDLTDMPFSNNMWADDGHLNYVGREMYSRHLIKIFNDTTF